MRGVLIELIKMNRSKKAIGILVLIMFAALTIGGCSGGQKPAETPAPAEPAEQAIEMRLGHVVQLDHPMDQGAQEFARLLEKKSNGRIKVTIFPARQLGDDRQLFEQVQNGAIDMAEVSIAPMGGWTPIATAWQLPFTVKDYETWEKILTSPANQKLLDGLAEVKVKGLAVYDSGYRHLVTTFGTVDSLDSLKGKKIRIAQTPLHNDIFSTLGAAPTPLAYGEIYSSLQNKVIDGLEMDLSAVVMEKHYEVAKYVTLSRHFTWPAVLLMSEQKWNSLSADDQKLVQEAATEAIAFNFKVIKELDAKSLAELDAKGVEVKELSSEELAEFKEAMAPIIEKYKAQHPLVKEFAESALNS